MSSVSPEQIVMEGSRERALVLPSWVPAQLSDVWSSMRKNIIESMKKGKQDPARTSQVMPAFAHNQT